MKPFDHDLDLAAGLLRITKRGFWEAATVAAYARALTPVFAELATLKPARTACIVDGSDFPIQRPGVTEAITAFIERIPVRPDQTAIVVGNALQKMQVTRNVVWSDVQLFETEAEAREWLRTCPPPGHGAVFRAPSAAAAAAPN